MQQLGYKILTFTIITCSTLITSSNCYAQRTKYKCPNGNVQYVPCWNDYQSRKPKSIKSKSKQETRTATADVIATQLSFQKVSKSEGIWQGYLLNKSNKQITVSVSLLFYEGKILRTTKELGTIKLEKAEKPVKFVYKAQLGVLDRLSWGVATRKIGKMK